MMNEIKSKTGLTIAILVLLLFIDVTVVPFTVNYHLGRRKETLFLGEIYAEETELKKGLEFYEKMVRANFPSSLDVEWSYYSVFGYPKDFYDKLTTNWSVLVWRNYEVWVYDELMLLVSLMVNTGVLVGVGYAWVRRKR